jgi:hypothetical protein
LAAAKAGGRRRLLSKPVLRHPYGGCGASSRGAEHRSVEPSQLERPSLPCAGAFLQSFDRAATARSRHSATPTGAAERLIG